VVDAAATQASMVGLEPIVRVEHSDCAVLAVLLGYRDQRPDRTRRVAAVVMIPVELEMPNAGGVDPVLQVRPLLELENGRPEAIDCGRCRCSVRLVDILPCNKE